MDLPVCCLPFPSDLLISSTSQSNKLAYTNFANASLVSIAYRIHEKFIMSYMIWLTNAFNSV